MGDCPVDAVTMKNGKPFIDPDVCTDCGICIGECESEAISEG